MEVNCEFCNRHYAFDPVDAEQVFRGRGGHSRRAARDTNAFRRAAHYPDERARDRRQASSRQMAMGGAFLQDALDCGDAVDGGKVLVNGARVKPARALKLGDELSIRTPGASTRCRLQPCPHRRGPAAEAAKLFVETEESQRKREEAKLDPHRLRIPTRTSRGRPTKSARRTMHNVSGSMAKVSDADARKLGLLSGKCRPDRLWESLATKSRRQHGQRTRSGGAERRTHCDRRLRRRPEGSRADRTGGAESYAKR